MKAASIHDYRELVGRRLPRFLFDYIDGGSYEEVTLGRNVADLQQIALRQRDLRDVSSLDLSVELFGQRLAMPVALGPIGLASMNARRGASGACGGGGGHSFLSLNRLGMPDRRGRTRHKPPVLVPALYDP